MITTTALTKSYRDRPVVRDVSFHCEPGTITGFLGPNGAAKSTTLRMIVGLTRPDHGTSTIDGRPFDQLPNPTRVVGTLLDPSAMHPGRSGRATLTIAARMADVLRPRRGWCRQQSPNQTVSTLSVSAEYRHSRSATIGPRGRHP